MSNNIQFRVILFKGSANSTAQREDHHHHHQNDEDRFVSILKTKRMANPGIIESVLNVPVLDFLFIELNILWGHLQAHQNFQGLILTSARCVESLKRCIELANGYLLWETNLKEFWLNKKIFCVGPSTASEFILSFGLDESFREKIILGKSGNSQSLAEYILKEANAELPLLYPCGSLKIETLPTCLKAGNIPFQAVTVYKTVQHSELEKTLSGLQNAPGTDTVKQVYVFFSPSGVGFVLPHLTDISTTYIVAIGPTTAAALKSIPLFAEKHIYQCSSPTPEALLEILPQIK